MQRRSLLRLGVLSPVAVFTSRYLGALPSKASTPIDDRERAQQLNRLAADIRTPDDARRLVDFIADLFADTIPHGLLSGSLLKRIAQAEFSAVTDAQKLIPEQRIAAAWNGFADTLHTPEECRVTSAEVHYLRDGLWASARAMWDRSPWNFWTVPSIYATRPDGALAPGCRAIEAIRVLWDLANRPNNLKGARDQVTKGELFSDVLRQEQKQPPATSTAGAYVLGGHAYIDPISTAQRQYIHDSGMRAFHKSVVTMLERTLS
jgi:hypothetical protein